VYKALDTRLDRTVAVKVLPEQFARREDLRARFEREARVVASLNHPYICVLHDSGSPTTSPRVAATPYGAHFSPSASVAIKSRSMSECPCPNVPAAR
jgi:serine/threonine protein kinase